jgi:hypothetical protein
MSRKVIVATVLVVAGVAIMNLVSASLVEANGSHARDHLASAQGPFPLLPLLAVMVWALPQRERRRPLIWVAALVICVGSVIDATGNLRIVDAIGGAPWNDAQAERLGPSRPGFEDGHDLAALGMSVVVAGAVGLSAVMAFTRNVHPLTAFGSAALSWVFPPWLAPGFGVVVIAIAVLRERNRRERIVGREPSVAL